MSCISVIRKSALRLQCEYITVFYLNIYTSLRLRAKGAHSPLQYCIAEESPGIPLLCTKHRHVKDITVLCPTSSVSGFSPSPYFRVRLLWTDTWTFGCARGEFCVCLNESFHQPAWPCTHKKMFLTEEHEWGITMNIIRGSICRAITKKVWKYVWMCATLCTIWKRMHVYLYRAHAAVIVCLHYSVLTCVCVSVCTVFVYGTVSTYKALHYMLRCVCIHYLYVCSAECKYVCVSLFVCTRLCVFIECGCLQILMAQLWEEREREREWVREARIKRSESNPLKLMTVCLSEWIYLSQMPGKLALKWFWWQTCPGYLRWQTPKMFMFTELEGRVERDGGVRKSEEEESMERERETERLCSVER